MVITSENISKQQVYATSGEYAFTLTASDGTNTDITSKIIAISEGPKAIYTADTTAGCTPFTVNFSSSSTAVDSEIASSKWDFRTGETGTGNSVQYLYKNAGMYDVILEATDNNGCCNTKQAANLITVIDRPVAAFSASEVFTYTPTLNVTYTNLSSGATQLTYL